MVLPRIMRTKVIFCSYYFVYKTHIFSVLFLHNNNIYDSGMRKEMRSVKKCTGKAQQRLFVSLNSSTTNLLSFEKCIQENVMLSICGLQPGTYSLKRVSTLECPRVKVR